MKKRLKKLELNRETLRTLETKELPQIQGGESERPRACSWISWCIQCVTNEPTACVPC